MTNKISIKYLKRLFFLRILFYFHSPKCNTEQVIQLMHLHICTCCCCCCCCLRSVTALFPRGRLPKEDLRRSPLPPRPLVTHGSVALHVPYPPILIVMHPASGQSPPPSSCPIQISYQVSGLPPPCLPVLQNPTYMNPSKTPHINCVIC